MASLMTVWKYQQIMCTRNTVKTIVRSSKQMQNILLKVNSYISMENYQNLIKNV